MTYDAASVAQYAEAVVAGNEPLQTFLRASIIRPDFLPKLDEWQAYIDETGKPPPNLVERPGVPRRSLRHGEPVRRRCVGGEPRS